jgi:hypothetical protein
MLFMVFILLAGLLEACTSQSKQNDLGASAPTIINIRITSGLDDAEERLDGSVNQDSSDLELMTDGSAQKVIGLRFINVNIPQRATISKAYLQFKTDETTSGATALTIKGQAVNTAAAFSTVSKNVSSRAVTQASVSWSPKAWSVVGEAGLSQRSPDISPIIQEIVNRSGWASANAIAILITGTGVRVAESFDGDAAGAPLLHVEYTTGPVENEAPVVNAGSDKSTTLTSAVSLAGRVTDDTLPDDTLTTKWLQVSGPGVTTFADDDALRTTATFSKAGNYTLRLRASDGELVGRDELNVAVSSSNSNVTLPARAAFYYPWFPETWTVNGEHVFYNPSAGYYNSSTQAVVDQHIKDLDYAKVKVGIASWWGPNTHQETTRIPLLLNRTQALGSNLKWAFYYEKEGFGNPSLTELKNDLAYIKSKYTSSSAYAKIGGKPVIFVYNADDSSCSISDRWAQAAEGEWYVVLKVFSGYKNCATQPSSWHQYSPVIPADQQAGYSYVISPGFWRADEGSARLGRDLNRWKQNVRDMVASKEPWQLVTTFNEWGEGTAVEPASEWGRAYLDALASDGATTPTISVSLSPSSITLTPGQTVSVTATVTGASNTSVTWSKDGGSITGSGNTISYKAPTTTGSYTLTATSVSNTTKKASATITVTTSSNTITFAAAGDFGGDDERAGTVMNDLKTRAAKAFFLVGDVSYNEITPESAWCDWVHGYLGNNYPMQLLVGNHEDDNGADGHIRNFTDCMPDRLNSTLGPGGYGVNYAFDLGPVTVVAASPNITVDGVSYDYASGSSERSWLLQQIRAAKTEGDWVIVGVHKNCITIGNKTCEIGETFAQLLIDEKVDLVLQGHDHDYQRSHSLSKIKANTVPTGAVADSGSDGLYRRGAGTVFVIVGNIGRSLTTCSHSDSEMGYFAAHHCAEEGNTKGYVLMNISSTQLEARFIPTVDGSYSDTFTIR